MKTIFRQAQCSESRIADRNRDPGVFGIPPIGGRADVRRESPQKLTTALRIVDVEKDVRAEIRLRTMAQNGRLNVVEGDHQLILSRNSSIALPMRSSRLVSTTVRFGLATYQKSAVIWWPAM